jgi:glutamate--cysteine ligase
MLNKDNLIQYFSDGIKVKGSEKIGTEHEKFIYSKKDLSLIPFHGERSISAVLKKFIENRLGSNNRR